MGEILVEGKFTVEEYRAELDKASGIPGLPGMIIHEPDSSFDGVDSGAKVQYRITSSLVDGTVDLMPVIVYKSGEKKGDK